MTQLSIDFDPPAQRHSPTSVAAAEAIKPDASRLRAQVIAFLRGRGEYGATDEEMQLGIPMAANTQRPRRRECEQRGSVINSGRMRLTQSGKQAVVWTLTSAPGTTP